MPDRFRIADLRVGDRKHEIASITALIRSKVVSPHRISAYVDRYGSAVRLVQMSDGDRLMALEDSSHEVIGAVTEDDIGDALREVTYWESRDVAVWSILDPEYPDNLRAIFNRPPLLFHDGTWSDEKDNRSVAVVGTRMASDLGLRRAEKLVRELAESKFTILSGLASGIDTVAHTTALQSGVKTIAVMGTGLDKRYPESNADLSREIVASGGALLTQFFPEVGPRRWTFPMRNVVMSGLSLATVVVEASETSGARMQARVALQHGRTVFLLKSLVESHEWARKYVNEGVYDTTAIPVGSTAEIVDRLDGRVLDAVTMAL